jgi:hypothetical protein
MKVEDIEEALNMHHLTEIVTSESLGEGLVALTSRGHSRWDRGETGPQCSRPMIEIVVDSSAPPYEGGVPCQRCGDFAYTWNCEAHTYWAPIGDRDETPGVRRNGDSVPAPLHTFMTYFPPSPRGFGMPGQFLASPESISIDSGGAQPLGFASLESFTIGFEMPEQFLAMLERAIEREMLEPVDLSFNPGDSDED